MAALYLFQSKDSPQKGITSSKYPPLLYLGLVLLHLEKRANNWREQNQKTRFPYDFLFYNQTKCNVMPTIQCSPAPRRGFRPALAALPVNSQEPPEQPALMRHSTGALELQLHWHSSECPKPGLPHCHTVPRGPGPSKMCWFCTRTQQEHVMLHHFGGRPEPISDEMVSAQLHHQWLPSQPH